MIMDHVHKVVVDYHTHVHVLLFRTEVELSADLMYSVSNIIVTLFKTLFVGICIDLV